MSQIAHTTVAVGIVWHPEHGFLLRFNPRWQKYAFVAKEVSESADVDALALAALDDDLQLKFPDASVNPLDTTGMYAVSAGTGLGTYYNFHVYELDLGQLREGSASGKEARYFPYQELRSSGEVSDTTKQIARDLIESREVVVAVLAQGVGGDRKCLLVHKPVRNYFLPSTRRKTDAAPESVAGVALRVDTGFEGPVQATWLREVDIVQPSQRFGDHSVQFKFHICEVELPECDPTDPEGAFAAALRSTAERKMTEGTKPGRRGYAAWFDIEELTSSPDVSPTMKDLVVRDI